MEAFKISTAQLDQLIAGWQKQQAVYAPVKKERMVIFDRISAPGEITWDYSNSKRSPKEFFFPHSEVMFKFQRKDAGAEVVNDPQQQEKRVIVGIRACDVKAIRDLNCVFDQKDYQDPYFVSRRDNTVLVAYACNQPCTTCFCTSLGIGPCEANGADARLVRLTDGFLVSVLTEKGKALFGTLAAAGQADLDKAARIQQDAEAAIKQKYSIEKLNAVLDAGFDSPLWEEIHRKCIGCGLCTYFCSTCHCFDMSDETRDKTGQRIRTWDSCMYPQFTLHTSGHNPRPGGKERWRQRLMHKFNYTVKNFNRNFCTGCGRCIINCPVNVDIREIIKLFTK
jgi:ferredoxin